MKKLALVDPSILEELHRLRESSKVDDAKKSKRSESESNTNREDATRKTTNEIVTSTARDLSLMYTNPATVEEEKNNYKQPNNYDLSSTEKRLIVLEKHLSSLLNQRKKSNHKSKAKLSSAKKQRSKTDIIRDYNESLAEMMRLRKRRRKSGNHINRWSGGYNKAQVSELMNKMCITRWIVFDVNRKN